MGRISSQAFFLSWHLSPDRLGKVQKSFLVLNQVLKLHQLISRIGQDSPVYGSPLWYELWFHEEARFDRYGLVSSRRNRIPLFFSRIIGLDEQMPEPKSLLWEPVLFSLSRIIVPSCFALNHLFPRKQRSSSFTGYSS